MIHFSNMTPEEYLRLNSENISPETKEYFQKLLDKVEELELELKASKNEIAMLEDEVVKLQEKVDDLKFGIDTNYR